MTATINYFEELIEQGNWKRLHKELIQLESFNIAEIIEETDTTTDIILFRLLPREISKEVFQLLQYDKQEQIIEGLAKNVPKLSALLNDLDPDDRTAFFEELPAEVTQRFLQILSNEERIVATSLLGYPENSIGRLMTPEFVSVKAYYTVEQTLEHIRTFGKDSETLNVIYVVDDTGKLIDDIHIREIILAKPEQKIEELMDSRFISLHAFDDQESAIRVFKDHDRVALPVINADEMLIGIVTFDDIMDVEEEEATEDFHRFGSIQDAIINPIKAKFAFLYKKRIIWLFILVYVNVFSGAVIAKYENIIASHIALVFFLPLLIASSGNAGAQSATLIIRSLASENIKIKGWINLFSKEFLVSFFLGITMAAGVSIIAMFRAPDIVPVVAITMIITVMAGSLLGLLLPFIFKILKMDPATASAPLITSIADIFGVLVYLSIATFLLL